MLLSMNNLFDGLRRKGYAASSAIRTGAPTLRGVRLLVMYSDEDETSSDEVAYVGPSNAFISTDTVGTIVCCRDDIIFIEDSNPEVIFNECSRIFDLYNQWEINLLEAVIEDKPLDHFMDLGHRVFQSPMVIRGINDQTYAITDQYAPDIHPLWRHRLEDAALANGSPEQNSEDEYLRRCYESADPLIIYSPVWKGRVLYSNLRSHQERIGAVMVYEYDHPFHEGDLHLMRVYTKIMEKTLLLHPKQFFPMSELEDILFRLLERQELDWIKVESSLRDYHWDIHHLYVMLCAEPSAGVGATELARARDMLKTRCKGICTLLQKGRLQILVNKTLQPQESVVMETLQQLSGSKLVFGKSMTYYDFSKTYSYDLQARCAVQAAHRKDCPSLSFEEIYGSVFREQVSRYEDLQDMIHPDVLRLAWSDEKHGTEYCRTLYAYLLCGCNSREASAHLSVHRNTLLYRIDKIRELLGRDFEDIRYRQILLTSLLLHSGPTLES